MKQSRKRLIAISIMAAMPGLSSFATQELVYSTISSSHIKGLKVMLDKASGQLSFSGLIHPDCKDFTEIQLLGQKAGESYPIQLVESSNNSCVAGKSESCTRNNCLDINTVSGLIKVAPGAVNVTASSGKYLLNRSGQVSFWKENLSVAVGDPEQFVKTDLEGLSFIDPHTRGIASQEEDLLAMNDEICLLQEQAELGDYDSYEQLIAHLQSAGLSERKAKLELASVKEKLSQSALDSEKGELAAILVKSSSSRTLKDVKVLHKELMKFAKSKLGGDSKSKPEFATRHPEKVEELEDAIAEGLLALSNIIPGLETKGDDASRTLGSEEQISLYSDAASISSRIGASLLKTQHIHDNAIGWGLKSQDNSVRALWNQRYMQASQYAYGNQARSPEAAALWKQFSDESQLRTVNGFTSREHSPLNGQQLRGIQLELNYRALDAMAVERERQQQQFLNQNPTLQNQSVPTNATFQ